jgi:hypothetical protein
MCPHNEQLCENMLLLTGALVKGRPSAKPWTACRFPKNTSQLDGVDNKWTEWMDAVSNRLISYWSTQSTVSTPST